MAAPDARPYVRMVTERLFPTLPGPVASGDRARCPGQGDGCDLVTVITPGTVLLTFLVFCRIGGCLMLMPDSAATGSRLRSASSPSRSRWRSLRSSFLPSRATLAKATVPTIVQLIASETLIGGIMGVVARILFLALQFMELRPAC